MKKIIAYILIMMLIYLQLLSCASDEPKQNLTENTEATLQTTETVALDTETDTIHMESDEQTTGAQKTCPLFRIRFPIPLWTSQALPMMQSLL